MNSRVSAPGCWPHLHGVPFPWMSSQSSMGTQGLGPPIDPATLSFPPSTHSSHTGLRSPQARNLQGSAWSAVENRGTFYWCVDAWAVGPAEVKTEDGIGLPSPHCDVRCTGVRTEWSREPSHFCIFKEWGYRHRWWHVSSAFNYAQTGEHQNRLEAVLDVRLPEPYRHNFWCRRCRDQESVSLRHRERLPWQCTG